MALKSNYNCLPPNINFSLPKLKVLSGNVKVKTRDWTGLGGSYLSVWAAVGIISYHQEDPPSPSQDQIDLSVPPSLMISGNLISRYGPARLSQPEEVK